MNIELVPSTGTAPLRMHHHNGRYYVEAPEAGNYWIRLINDSASRREVVLSVDGIDAVNGKDASFENRGWVLNPGQTADIKGWYRSTSEVAAFLFGKAGTGTSYAEKTGRGAGNVGIIAAAVFAEKERPFVWPQHTSLGHRLSEFTMTRGGGGMYSSSAPIGGATMDSFSLDESAIENMASSDSVPVSSTYSSTPDSETKTSGSLGLGARTRGVQTRCSVTKKKASLKRSDLSTGYGERVTMHTSLTDFERASSTPLESITLQYATREMLLSWGVPIDAPVGPNPWPGNPGGVPAPSDWRG